MPTFAITLAGLVLLDIGIIRTILQHPPRVWSNSMGAVNSMGKSGVGDQARGEILVKDCALTELLEIYKPCPRSHIVGAVVMNTGVKYFAMVVFTIGTYAVNSLILGWVGSTCGQSTETKAAAISIVNTVMNASFIWTPYLWDSKDAPQYRPAMFSSAAFSAGTALVAWIVKIIMKRRNEKLRQSEDEIETFYVY
ncbi:hypothetical protein KCU93_g5745, partial [Aureobasidium melanogenum]